MPPATYLPEEMGTASVTPGDDVEAGSYQEFTLTYRAGKFGIDDTGSLKIVHRFASDMGRPQFDTLEAANYVTVEACNGAGESRNPHIRQRPLYQHRARRRPHDMVEPYLRYRAMKLTDHEQFRERRSVSKPNCDGG